MMSFPFRRRERNQFKHIAHGLIPAATVAPRSAVPRTPPPRSPNPSPERPRSALAAAILLTSLTGRTVAIPQPRQRSYSENDSTYIEETSIIEPYATARELGVEKTWEYTQRKNRNSPVRSLSFEDEDTEEQMSDIEREHHLSEPNEETVSNVPIYATPNKKNKKNLHPPVSVVDDVSAMSFHDVNLETSPKITDSNPEEVDSHLGSSIPSPDYASSKSSPRRKPTPEIIRSDERKTGARSPCGAATESIEQLNTKNQYLSNENQGLTNQVQELKQQIKSLRVKLKNLKNEKRGHEQSWNKQQNEADAAELISLREQAQELVDENDALKMTVHRLNVELSRYQTKFRPLSKEENMKIGGLPHRGPPPPWLLDMKYLSPLLLAYEDRMKEKDDRILSFQEEMNDFKTRINEIIEENENLHQKLAKKRHITTKEWHLMQTQAQLVLEENQVLIEQLEIQQAKEKDIHTRHMQEVSRLTKQLMVLEAKKQSQEEELLEIQKQQEVFRSKYDELKANMDSRIAEEEHVAMVNKLKSQLQQEQDERKTEVEDLMSRIAIVQAQKKSLLLEKNNLIADNKTLESEMESTKQSNRKLQRKLGQLKHQLEDAIETEVTSHQYLANLIMLAENITEERNKLIHTTNGLEAEKLSALTKMVEGNVRLGQLEEMVRVHKTKSAGKVVDISHRLTEQEEDFAGKAAQYQREIKHLQRLLQDKQETLDEVLQQKRQVEAELEVIWESTANETKQLKALLHKSLTNNKRNTSNDEQVIDLQQKSVNDYDFGYCDVNSSPQAEDLIKMGVQN